MDNRLAMQLSGSAPLSWAIYIHVYGNEARTKPRAVVSNLNKISVWLVKMSGSLVKSRAGRDRSSWCPTWINVLGTHASGRVKGQFFFENRPLSSFCRIPLPFLFFRKSCWALLTNSKIIVFSPTKELIFLNLCGVQWMCLSSSMLD